MSDTVEVGRAALRAAEDSRAQALLSQDWDLLASLLDEDLVVTHSNGRRDTRDSFLQSCSSGRLLYLRFEQDISAIALRRDHAVVSAVLHARIVLPDDRELDVHALSTAVWSRIGAGSGWRLLAVHTTSVPTAGADPTRQPPRL